MEKEQEQQERRCLPMGEYALDDTVSAFNWRERSAADQTLSEDLWDFFRNASWFVRVWPHHTLADQAKNSDLDDRYVIPELTLRKRNGTCFYRFAVNNAVFNMIVYPRKSPVLLHHSGNGFSGYFEFAWGTAPATEEVK